MNRVIYPGSRIARLPRIMRFPALLMRNVRDQLRQVLDVILLKPLYGFVYHSDGLATIFYSPFLGDHRFRDAYQRMAGWWWQDRYMDVRWRMWFLTRCAEQCRNLPGSFVEFGVYRAGCAFMILNLVGLDKDQRFYLFDTFRGVPETNLTEAELRDGFSGKLGDTSVAHVQEVLHDWSSDIVLVEGDIFDTLPETETGPIALCHLDLNASAPTKRALEYIYPRLLSSAMIVLDDYGQRAYDDQRRVIDAFFADKPEQPFALPTGQGLVVKL